MALRTPAFSDAKTYGFEWLRLLLEASLQEGALGAGDFKVTAAAAGAPLRVDVAAGMAAVKGDSGVPGAGLSHGLYLVVNDAAVANAVSLVAAHATLPRIDQIVLRVRDTADLGSAADDAVLEVVTGTATTGATLDNRTGAGALPADALRLADVLIPAAATAVIAGNVRDRRPWARGAYHRGTRASSTPTTTSTTPVTIDSTPGVFLNRYECSGVPASVEFHAVGVMAAGTDYLVLTAWLDGVNVAEVYSRSSQLGNRIAAVYPFTPTPGSHVLEFKFNTSNAGVTATIVASAASPANQLFREDVRANAANN